MLWIKMEKERMQQAESTKKKEV